MVLQFDIGSEFIADIVSELIEIWPEAEIIHGWACYPQPQGFVERENQDIKTMISTWMQDHDTNNWVLGLNFVQLAKNTRHHSGIGNDPYTVMYGQNFRLGFSSLSINPEVIASIGSELDLDMVLNSVSIVDPNQGSQVTTPRGEEVDEAITEEVMDPMAHKRSRAHLTLFFISIFYPLTLFLIFLNNGHCYRYYSTKLDPTNTRNEHNR
jgi:hypothetical protein